MFSFPNPSFKPPNEELRCSVLIRLQFPVVNRRFYENGHLESHLLIECKKGDQLFYKDLSEIVADNRWDVSGFSYMHNNRELHFRADDIIVNEEGVIDLSDQCSAEQKEVFSKCKNEAIEKLQAQDFIEHGYRQSEFTFYRYIEHVNIKDAIFVNTLFSVYSKWKMSNLIKEIKNIYEIHRDKDGTPHLYTEGKIVASTIGNADNVEKTEESLKKAIMKFVYNENLKNMNLNNMRGKDFEVYTEKEEFKKLILPIAKLVQCAVHPVGVNPLKIELFATYIEYRNSVNKKILSSRPSPNVQAGVNTKVSFSQFATLYSDHDPTGEIMPMRSDRNDKDSYGKKGARPLSAGRSM